jgi:serine/threonine-protein kinase
MATVWMARLTGTRGFQKPVAIKTMLPSIREDPDAEKMFLSEAAVASRIRHPNVVEILDLGEEQGVLYLVMEWIHGEPLGGVLAAAAKRGGMPLSLAVRIGMQTCAALHAAHELTDDAGNPLGLVHRDVSPHNVLAGFDGVIKLVDFGIAKVTAEATHLTEMGMVRGKIAYMAPEQIRFEKLDRRTDVFAAGILLYQLTTGRHPFKRSERNETALAICDEKPVERPTSFLPSYPERVERVVLKALEKDPANRYATARDLGEDLARTMPPALRGGSQDELQKYLRDLLPERLSYHEDLIRRALAGHTGVYSPISVGRSGLPTAQSSSTLRAVSVSDASDEIVLKVPGTENGPGSETASVPPPPKPRTGRAALAAAVAGAVVGAVAIVGLTSRTLPGQAGAAFDPRPSAAAPAMPVQTVAVPEIAPTASAAQLPAAPDAGAGFEHEATPAPTATAVHKTPKPKQSKRASSDHGASEPLNTGTVLKDPYGP